MPKEETFPIPLKNTDATRSTHTDLDVTQEKRIDGYWNVDSNRSLSDSWKGFAKITLLKEKHPRGYMWFGRRLTEVQKTTRSYQVWPEVWSKIGNAVQNLEKQEWKTEKPKLDNAGRLRGSCFIDPQDEEFEETIKNAMKKLEVPMEAAMPCKKGELKVSQAFRKLVGSLDASQKVPKPNNG